MFGVAPLLVIHAISHLIFIILSNRLPPTDDNTVMLCFSATIVDGMLYFTVLSLLIFSLMSLDSPSGDFRPQHGRYHSAIRPVSPPPGEVKTTEGISSQNVPSPLPKF